MNKTEFINFLNNEDINIASKIYDKILLAEKSGKAVFLNEFYHPGLWTKLVSIAPRFELNIMVEGIFTDSERRMVAFCNETVEAFPIKLIKITNKSKFTKLEHRDYLGAMMSLGVKREKIGDFVIQGNSCYVAICEDIYEYIVNNLTAIGKCPCEIVEELDFCGLPSIEYKEETIIATSQRLDCIVGSLTNLSRSKAILLINAGKVLLNYEENTEKDKVVQLGSTITIRGFGKYRIVDVAGSSNSGRLKINVKKYI